MVWPRVELQALCWPAITSHEKQRILNEREAKWTPRKPDRRVRSEIDGEKGTEQFRRDHSGLAPAFDEIALSIHKKFVDQMPDDREAEQDQDQRELHFREHGYHQTAIDRRDNA